MLRYAAWSHRFGALGYGGFLLVFAVVEVSSYLSLSRTTTERSAFAVQMQRVGESTTFLVEGPHHVEFLGGYLQWFLIGFFPLFFPVWGLIAGTGAFRGEEESGLLEAWLATGLTRGRLVLDRLAGFTLALGVAVAAIDGFTFALAASAATPLDGGALIAQSIAQAAVAPPIFMLGALLSQVFPTRRNALGVGALILGGLFLVNSASRQAAFLRPVHWVSPWAYPDLSYAMTPGGEFSLGGIAVLVALALVLALGVWLLLRGRDLGSALVRGERVRPPSARATGNPLLGRPALGALWEQRVGLLMWSLGLVLYCFVNVPLTNRFVEFFQSQAVTGSPVVAEQARLAWGFGTGDPAAGFVSAGWFHIACIILAVYAITQVARWSGEDADGRLEMVLAGGRPRWRVSTDRMLALTVGLSVLAGVDFLAVMPALRAGDVHLDTGRVLLASVLVLPVGLAFGAAGAAVAAFRPRLAVWTLSAAVAIGYLIPLMAAQIFRHPPQWFLDLSPFQLYGAPLLSGVDWKGLWILVAVAALGFGISTLALNRREVGR